MKKFLFFIFVLLSFNIKAQEYKEGMLYGVTGPVKFLSTHRDKVSLGMVASFLDSASFTSDGKREKSMTVFDEDGYPLGFSIDVDTLNDSTLKVPLTELPGFETAFNGAGNLFISYKVDYDDNYRISSTLLEYHINFEFCEYPLNISMTVSTSFDYTVNSVGIPEVCRARILYKSDDDECEIECNYSNYLYDENGNWISRNVLENSKSIGNQSTVEVSKYTEDRFISYYN